MHFKTKTIISAVDIYELSRPQVYDSIVSQLRYWDIWAWRTFNPALGGSTRSRFFKSSIRYSTVPCSKCANFLIFSPNSREWIF